MPTMSPDVSDFKVIKRRLSLNCQTEASCSEAMLDWSTCCYFLFLLSGLVQLKDSQQQTPPWVRLSCFEISDCLLNVLFLSWGWLDVFEVGPWHLTPLDSVDFAFVPVAKLPRSFGKHKGRTQCLKVMLSWKELVPCQIKDWMFIFLLVYKVILSSPGGMYLYPDNLNPSLGGFIKWYFSPPLFLEN